MTDLGQATFELIEILRQKAYGMRIEVLTKRPEIMTVNTIYEALEKVDQLLDQHGLEVILWDNKVPHPHYSFSIVTRET